MTDLNRRLSDRSLGLDQGRVRLDLLANPYGPSFAVQEALAESDLQAGASGMLESNVRGGLARTLRVPATSVVLANGIDAIIRELFVWLRNEGPLVIFPPSDPHPTRLAEWAGLELTTVFRTPRFDLRLDPLDVAELPVRWSGYIQSPNDPSGTIMATDDVVRLARGARVLIVDERHGAYTPRSLRLLAREFDNVVIVGTLETWAGLAAVPLAYAILPPRLMASFERRRVETPLALGAVVAAQATLDDLPAVLGTVHRVRAERSRMFRALRKLNMVSVPFPSWSNFLLVQAERSPASVLVEGLRRRGIEVAAQDDRSMGDRLMRVSAGWPEHTDQLQRALIEIGATI